MELINLRHDSDANVRLDILKYREKFGEFFDVDTVKGMLVQHEKSESNALLNSGWSDLTNKGEMNFDRYIFELAKNKNENEIDTFTDKNSLILVPNEFITKYYYFYDNNKSELVDFLNCNFKIAIEHFNEKIKNLSGIDDLDISKKLPGDRLYDYVKNEVENHAISLISIKDDASLIHIVRKHSKNEKFVINHVILSYLVKYGDFEDIKYLINKEYNYSLSSDSLFCDAITKEKWEWKLACAIVKLSGDNYLELLEMKINVVTFLNIIYAGRVKFFDSLDDEKIISLLKNESAEIRKAISLKLMLSCNRIKVERIIEKYYSFNYIFYNVIFWFDLYKYVPIKVVKRTIKNMVGPSNR